MYSGIEIFPTSIEADDVLKYSADYFKKPELTIRSKTRKQEIVKVRFFIFKYLRSNTDLPLKSIGSYFSGRDHSTVLHGLRAFENWVLSEEIMGVSDTMNEYLAYSKAMNIKFRFTPNKKYFVS